MNRLLLCALALFVAGCAKPSPAAPPAVGAVALAQEAFEDAQPPGYHLHLPGIGGYRSIDKFMLQGLADGGVKAEVHPYDWTGSDAGLAALVATRRHRDEAAKIARLLTEAARQNPRPRITVTTHSAGAGIIAWALEQLPPDVTIDALALLSPALSPAYDLSPALRHVKERVYVLYSPYDAAVLGIGTRMFGTVDGVKAEASGKVGFVRPPSADAQQYEKLVQLRYRSDWIKLGNIGDHIGSLSRPFAREILAPLLISGTLPKAREDPLTVPPPPPGAATVPATQAAAAD